jgi:glyoxylase-like metal-dependent hydrolase (beta-lactamase superfamily II)
MDEQGHNEEMSDTMADQWIPMTSIASGKSQSVLPDLHYLTVQIVNVIFVGDPSGWVLVDAGMPQSAEMICSEAEKRFGEETRPKAIILTHGHFDHVGALVELVKRWKVPVYAHSLELPFLTGKESYPDPDPTVEGGLLAKISPIYPNEPIDLQKNVHSLPNDGTIPFMPEWRWIHTPGHSPGHVSFFRERDRALIAGDAFITVKQDSLYKVLTQEREINGPPRYFTTDWEASRESVKKLESLKPEQAITGHGPSISGEELRDGLRKLVRHFDEIAIPDYGKYVDKNNS